MALIAQIDKISVALDNGEIVIGVFLEFSKAFDTVNHEILLNKLCTSGFDFGSSVIFYFTLITSLQYQRLA